MGKRKKNQSDKGLEFEFDFGGGREQKITIINPSGFMAGGWGAQFSQRYTNLYLFQFGAVGTTWLLVWDDDAGGFEGSLEEAASWLAEHAPGHITDESELWELMREAAEEKGLSLPKDPKKSDVDWNESPWTEVSENATADMTYTESGYLTSYEWSGSDVDFGKPLYTKAFELSFKHEEDELDEEDHDKARELLSQLKTKTRRKLKSKLLR